MKIGDKVRVIRLDDVDKEQTSLKVGDIGTVNSFGVSASVAYVSLEEVAIDDNATNLNKDGTYQLFSRQLEVIEENGGNDNE